MKDLGSASIGGFDVDETTISTDDSLILKSSGQITGSATLLGNKTGGNFLQFKDSTLTVQGDITADNIRTPNHWWVAIQINSSKFGLINNIRWIYNIQPQRSMRY